MNMTFPVDNTFSDCYKNRKSCIEKDFSAEVSVMILMTKSNQNVRFR